MKTIWFVLGGIAAAGIALVALWSALSGYADESQYPDNTTHEEWKQALTVANGRLPTMVDEATRLDRVSDGPGRVVNYYYTLVKYPIDGRSPKEIHDELDRFESHLRTQACTTESTRFFLDQGLTINYHYSNKYGQRLFDVHVHHYECKS